MKNVLYTYLLMGAMSLSCFSCTDLHEEILNEQDGDKIVTNFENIGMIVSSSYAYMRDLNNRGKGAWCLGEITTDEVAFPARGTDAYVPDRMALFTHEYVASNTYIRNCWNTMLSGLAKTNVSLLYLSKLPQTDEVIEYTAEVKFIRALTIYLINDFWGQVPFREYEETDYLAYPVILSREEAVNRVVNELNEIIPILKTKSELPYGRVSRATAQMLLAKVYLNYEVYTSSPKWEEAAKLCDEIINSKEYVLADDYFAMFSADNESYISKNEAILAIVYDGILGLEGGSEWINMTLHYNQIFGTYTSLWNMACTTGTFVDTWDESDTRFKDTRSISTLGFNLGFLMGQQYSIAGEALKTRTGAPLSFTKDFSIQNSKEEQGVRVVKYGANASSPKPSSPDNDYLFFRYADVMLMSAEAKYRMGDTQGALALVNTLRTTRKNKPLQNIDLTILLNERGFELYWEGHRRNDLIRFGKYCEVRQEKEHETPTYKLLLPIPVSALEANSQLSQNPGY